MLYYEAHLAGQKVGRLRALEEVKEQNKHQQCIGAEDMFKAIKDWFDVDKYRAQIWERYEQIRITNLESKAGGE